MISVYFLKEAIQAYFKARNVDISLKYIDPSYIIRSLPANANDHAFLQRAGAGCRAMREWRAKPGC